MDTMTTRFRVNGTLVIKDAPNVLGSIRLLMYDQMGRALEGPTGSQFAARYDLSTSEWVVDFAMPKYVSVEVDMLYQWTITFYELLKCVRHGDLVDIVLEHGNSVDVRFRPAIAPGTLGKPIADLMMDRLNMLKRDEEECKERLEGLGRIIAAYCGHVSG